MPELDLDHLVGERLARPLATAPPPLRELQRRVARRRHRRAAVALAGAAACVAVALTAPVLSWPGGEREQAGVASGPQDGVLDAGTARDGEWRVVVTRDDGWCVKRVSATGEGGACGLATPGRLAEASQFPTWDGEEYVVVVAGPAPPGTSRIEVSAEGVTAVATVVEVEGRLFWSARLPPGEGGTRATAYDGSGAVIEQFSWPPLSAPD